jgi:hypothetical protein
MVRLDLVAEMLTRAVPPRHDAAIAWTGSGLSTALRLASTLRLFGMRAVVDTEARTSEGAKTWWQAVGAANLLYCRDSAPVAWTAPGKRARSLRAEQVAARLAGGEG